ncbi:pitrilysin family protein [Hellea sp.]|nr:insulinase family protein [Hellea sp.]MDC1061729.1 pitrilysin family protein [Hellea sp.]MDC1088628.1 pitrilysin family protein [Hellea sp.]
MKRNIIILSIIIISFLAIIVKNSDKNPTIEFEKFILDNGLEVILHIDRSDPIVAINLAAKVGSGREKPGRTGFAHLFEHLLFLDSENLGYGGLDEMNTRIGGDGTNGFTTNDMTQYFQAVPKEGLEKIIWAEADKLGWFINTVTQDVLDNEKQVVKNEKRQRVDNRPYGHNRYIVSKAIYPSNHPYNWQVIGSLEDLDSSTLGDVKEFYSKWYVPNNVTLTLSGDFKKSEAKNLITKYFGEIPKGEDISTYEAEPVSLKADKSFYHEDNFATLPQLSITWPTVKQYHPDSYALDILINYLTEGKNAPLNQSMIEEDKVTSQISSYNHTKEIAGELYMFMSPNENKSIDSLLPPLKKGFARFENNGISERDLNRIKAGVEVDFYQNIQSALGKAIQLSEYNTFTNNPGFFEEEINNILSVTEEDIMRVYNKYIKGKNAVYVSFVPKGQIKLALSGAVKAEIEEEEIKLNKLNISEYSPENRIIKKFTPSSFDRSIEPSFGESYEITAPNIWRDQLKNGLDLYGNFSNETPLINFSLFIDAGRKYGAADKPAIPRLLAEMLSKGTANKTTSELEEAIQSLGSSISIRNDVEGTYISGFTLSKNFNKTINILKEILTNPRWDQKEFELLKIKVIEDITKSEGNPNFIAYRENAKLSYKDNNILHYVGYGPKNKIEAVVLDDLKDFYNQFYNFNKAKLRIVGNYDTKQIKEKFSFDMVMSSSNQRSLPEPANPVGETKIYFYDIPDSKQSVLTMNYPSLKATDENYLLAKAINFSLGGIYTSKLNSKLRIEKGYTYGIRSAFNGTNDEGSFQIQTSVRTNVTKEAIELIRDIVTSYGTKFTPSELEIMKNALIRGKALENETLTNKLQLLNNISLYNYDDNYQSENTKLIKELSIDKFKLLAAKYILPSKMNILVVGDAKTQLGRLKELGYGDPILLNKH